MSNKLTVFFALFINVVLTGTVKAQTTDTHWF